MVVDPSGLVTEAEATFVTLSASKSAWVTEYMPVHVIMSFGARPVAGSAGQETAPPAPSILSSATEIGVVSVVLPEFVTRYE